MRNSKKVWSLLLVAALGLSGLQAQPDRTDAAAKVSISAKKLTIIKGKSKTLRIKNAKKQVTWKLSKKKYVTIKKAGKNKIKITGKKVGVTKITAKLGTKKYACTVKVKKVSPTATPKITPKATPKVTPTASPTKPASTATPDTKVPMKISKKAVNEANVNSEILSRHTNFHMKQTGVEGLSLMESYIDNKTFYVSEGKKKSYLRGYSMLYYDDMDGTGDYGYILGIPFFYGGKSPAEKTLARNSIFWHISDEEEILSCYSEDGKIYLTTKLEGENVRNEYGSKCDGKEGVYTLFEVVLNEDTLEAIQNTEYLCDKSGAKEWMRTTVSSYDVEEPACVTEMADTYQAHWTCEDMESRKLSITLGTGTTQEDKETMEIPKGDAFRVYFDEDFANKYGTELYADEACTQTYKYENDNRESDVSLYFALAEEEVEESDTISYADGVTSKMSSPDFWANLCADPDKLLANDECINSRNEKMLEASGTNMNDLKNMSETYNGIQLRENLATSVVKDANRSAYYANGELVDKTAYFTVLKNNIANDETATENDTIKYAVCTTRTEVKWCPTSDYLGYSATDADDEGVNSAIGINEPMVLKARTADGKFYWGYTENCTGWVAAEDVAICSSKEEWLDSWEVKTGEKNFLVVTTDRIVTETSFYNPAISARTLTLGTCLKLVEKENIPDNLNERGNWNNYIVYLPTRNADGQYVKEMAMISEHSNVSVGYLPFTERNILKVAFECLGNRYGWGGSLEAMDCSLYVCLVYRCFGFSLPRNTSWQQAIPSFNKIEGKTDDEKTGEIKKSHVGSVLYFSGHEMMYLGRYKGRTYVISALGTVFDVGDTTKRSVYNVSINTLDVKRANGNTWLANLSGINTFQFDLK